MKSFTLNESIRLNGVGLHTGVKTNINLIPSPIGSGIFFNRIDKSVIIPAKWDNVVSTKFSTNLASNEIEVKTVEHLLSALSGLHINNCEISICETKNTEELFNNPEHEYTKELIRLMPKIESII